MLVIILVDKSPEELAICSLALLHTGEVCMQFSCTPLWHLPVATGTRTWIAKFDQAWFFSPLLYRAIVSSSKKISVNGMMERNQ